MRFPRCSGILLHPTSLPGQFGSGDLGSSCYHFIDWLATAGQSLWQMLPVGPIGSTNSPYLSPSAFAGNPLLIDLQELIGIGLLGQNDIDDIPNFPDHRANYGNVKLIRTTLLKKAAASFYNSGSSKEKEQFDIYCEKEKYWLDDYAVFQAVNIKYDNLDWNLWDREIVNRGKSELGKIIGELSDEITFQKFAQWSFDRQWNSVKKYANEHGVKLVGDIPIFVAHQSADVWTRPEMFYLYKNGSPKVVAGVPPDYFSATGQRWGNPLYRWDKMKENNFNWWINRFKRTLELFDIVRIDHFRGFEAYWEIPEKEENAVKGKWVKGPGIDFFRTMQKKLGALPIIAEDLGLITNEVHSLRKDLDFPGMKVLQFAFSEGPENCYLPHNYEPNCVVYTGTHDNDTTRGWYEKISEHERDFVRRYCKTDGININWDMIRLAIQSTADISIIPFQDIIGLGSEGRMNYPGTEEGNWEWRFTWNQVGPEPAEQLYKLAELYGRCNSGQRSKA